MILGQAVGDRAINLPVLLEAFFARSRSRLSEFAFFIQMKSYVM